MPDSTLTAIRTKVRRLTGRPSTTQLTNAEIDEYVNTFYLYDMPEILRLFSLKTVFSFMTTANVDQYDLKTLNVTINGFTYPASDVYYNLQPPAYIAGYQSFWSESREQFFRYYPPLAQIQDTLQGNGTPGPYNFTFSNVPILQYQVTVGTIDNGGTTINAIDVPTNRTTGTWTLINTATPVVGSINYLTGVGTITFANPILAGQEITVTAVPYQPNRPQSVLYYDNTITLRPVPDKEYLVQMDAYQTPTEFVNANDTPEIRQWWQYLAFGAAKKILEDSGDTDQLPRIQMGFKEQESLVLRRSIVQQTSERTATIYTEMTQYPYGNFQGRF